MLISLTGPSGVGKGYVKERIFEAYPGVIELVWTTTRPLRRSETGRSNRRSVTRGVFKELNDQGMFVCVQSLHGHLYGIERSELERYAGIAGLTETNIGNMTLMRQLVSDFVPIALVCVDLAFLRERLTHYRGENEGDDLESRLCAAEREMQEIQQQRQHFALVVEVSKENETRVAQQVLDFLQARLGQGERT